MSDAPAFKASDLRANLDRHIELLRTHPSSAHVIRVASNIAKGISPDLVRRAESLPMSTNTPYSISDPRDRTDEFDQAVEAFIAGAYETLYELAQHESRCLQNASLSRDKCRERVFEYLKATGREYVWASQIGRALTLSYDQVLDALESLAHEDLIDGKKQDWGENPAWRVRLSVNGRNVADGKPNSSTLPVSLIHQEFHPGSAAAAVGVNYGHVVQNITAFPPFPKDVREALLETPDGSALLEALDDAATSGAKPSIVKGLVTALKTAIESANLSTEVLAHGHEWLQAASHWLASIHA